MKVFGLTRPEQLELFVVTAGALAIVFGLRAHVEGPLLRGDINRISIAISDPCGLKVDETKPYTLWGVLE